uniref:microtubule-associated tumor suppressor 1 homolog isoform X1 n=1 Tax=Pristiophorus japonicus TaxID=55135 RepID=UPI00398E3581
MEIFKMSFQVNSSGMGESSDSEISSFHLPVLISDPNGNEVPSSTKISPETIHVTAPLTNGHSVSSDVQMLPFNIGVDVGKSVSDQAACLLQGICGPELEMARDYLCDHEASFGTVIDDSRSSSSDDQYMTANLSWNSKSSVTSTDPGQCVLEHTQNHTVKSQLPCSEVLSEYYAIDTEQKLNLCVTNEAHLKQKTLQHPISGNSLKSGITDNPNDMAMRITTNMETSLKYSILPSEFELEMKDSSEHESSLPVLESSIFSNSSNDQFVTSDQSLEAFESPGVIEMEASESPGVTEIMDDTKITYQLPVETNLNTEECAVDVSNPQHALDKAEKMFFQTDLSNQNTGLSQFPTLDPNQNLKERAYHSATSSADVDTCVKYQLEETVNVQLPVLNEQCYQEINIKRPNRGMAVAKMGEVYKKPISSTMNATFIVLREENNYVKPGSEIISWRTEAQEIVPQAAASIQGNVNDETFLDSSPTIHEDASSYSQTSTLLTESRKMVFFSSPFQNLTHLTDSESCSTPEAEDSPTDLVLQPNTRGPGQKPCCKIKCNTNVKAKLMKVEIKCYPKPNFNNVKPKVVSRAQQISSPPKSNVSLAAEGSSKYFPRSASSISSLQSPCSPSPALMHLKKEPVSQSPLKPKSPILKLQKVVFRKTPLTNKLPATAITENKTTKCNRNNSLHTKASSTSAFANGAESQICGSLHFSKLKLSSVGATTHGLKTFHCDGTERTKPSKQIVPVVEKSRAPCRSLAGAIDDHFLNFNGPVSATALEKVHTTVEAPLTKLSAPSISDVQVGRRPSIGNTRSLTVQSPSAKIRVPPSVPKSRLGSVNKNGCIGNMQCPTSKQPLISGLHTYCSAKTFHAAVFSPAEVEDRSDESRVGAGGRTFFGVARWRMPVDAPQRSFQTAGVRASPNSHGGEYTEKTGRPPRKLADEQKGISIKAKPRLATVKTTLKLGGNAIKSTPSSKLPVPASGLQRVNSLSSVSSSVSVQSVLSTCSNKSTVASTNRGGDGPHKCLLSARISGIQKQSTQSVLQNRSVSVKTPCRGAFRNVTIPSSQILPGSSSRSARQLSTAQKLKADRTWVKSNSSIQRPGSRTPCATTQAPPDLLPVEKEAPGLHHYRTKCEKQIEWIAWLKELLKTSNQRFEAVAIVVQYLQAQREEVGKQHKELSQELVTLHNELETRNLTCVQLEKDREVLQNKYEGVIQQLSGEHQTELKRLEERLKQLFTAEKELRQQNFKNDVEKLHAQLQKEVEGLTSKHEAHKLELVATHSKNLESLEKEYDQSLAELTRSHELEQKTLEESFKERHSLLQDQIAELNEQNESLKEEIKTQEEVIKTQGQKDQKIDPLSQYLNQELESLKAVLEIKNEKIHHQEKKLMQMEKLMEKHIVLDEKLKIVLQENEDLKARMDKHIAVSRQLSTEQVVLQESLQKESKVNKRLSMENEELLWKLQNGDILSPKKLSPTSSFSFQPSKNSVSSSSSPAPSPR